MAKTVYDKLRGNVDTVVIPAIQSMEAFVEEQAPRTAAHGAIQALNCGFLAGITYAITVCETESAINDERKMREFLCDVLNLMLETNGW